ncbi:hypothetical protein [Mesorhizobium sp. INR15]|uniref:hypothetical protein n=1 Tax=Mesorhizobium sp. INR15 TaxID=2654248 RepID=UPI0027E41D00|nr:hypothetical protein [Mesorhizobium sp. INR15]
MALAVAPYHIALHGFAAGIVASSAQAKAGGNDRGNRNGGGNDGNGGGNSGGGGDDNGNGNGGSNGNSGGDNSGNSSGRNNGKGTGNSKSSGTSGAVGHVNAATEDRVEIDGDKIEVQHPDGFHEEIDNGRFKMKDALGRTIVNRRATAADISRLKGL